MVNDASEEHASEGDVYLRLGNVETLLVVADRARHRVIHPKAPSIAQRLGGALKPG